METSPAQAITHNEGYCQQSYASRISDINQAVKGIEDAYQQLLAGATDDSDRIALVHALHQCAALPSMLKQQLRMIEGLGKQFPEQFSSKCGDEVEEMSVLSKGIRKSLESAVSSKEALDQAAQVHLVESLFKDTSRLNLLQQRISGKMMKVKPV